MLLNNSGRLCALIAVAVCCSTLLQSAAARKTERIIFVMTDGFRWQELFRGADESLMNKEYGAVEDVIALKAAYWRDTADGRRRALLPFLWEVVARQGQLYGNPDRASEAYVTNGLNFSYPGYSETFCGFPDPRVNSNDKVPNPNVTMFEWLNKKRAFQGQIAAFGAWDAFPYILNAARSGLLVNAGWDPFHDAHENERFQFLNQLKRDTPKVWADEPFDALPFYTALEYLKLHKPRLLYLSLGETDDWAHAGNYAEYLNSAHRADSFLRTLWETVQSMPEYRGRTTLIFTPDHGRGNSPVEWKNHGEKVPESKYIWLAFLGPDTPALGERSQIEAVKQNQIAATIAALLGEDYRRDVPNAGVPITDALPVH
jgi:hypothetical protein